VRAPAGGRNCVTLGPAQALHATGAAGQTEHEGRDAIRGILADGDYVVRQHTMYAKTHRGQDYTNVYCFVFRFDSKGRIRYLTEHWNTWHAYNVLFNNFKLEPAHPTR
jgi:ketosteroid isomerase-like protein